jgi:threonine aldolase
MEGFRRIAQCSTVPVETDGVLTGPMVRECVEAHGLTSGTAIICAENTHGLRGGIPWGAEVAAGLVEVAQERGLRLHLDGARIFNAAVAIGASVAQLAAGADTVQICLAKGLGAPLGSLVLGSRAVVAEARQARQKLGGGIHKAGVMAAAGLVALREGPAHIPDDHRRAERLATLLTDQPLLSLMTPVRTNIVDLLFDPGMIDGAKLVASAAAQGVASAGPWKSPRGQWLRLVTHCEITDRDVEDAAAVIAAAVGQSER